MSNTLKIRRHHSEHNHEVGEHMFKHYPEQRRLPEDLQEIAKSLLKVGAKSKSLQNHLMQSGQPFITTQDLHNFRFKLKQESVGNRSDEELLVKILEDIHARDPDSTINITTSTDGILEVLFSATSDMKDCYTKYPEVLFIDGTYQVNKLRLPLYTFLVEDAHGTGQPVAYCFVANERRECIDAIFQALTSCVDTSKTSVVIMDKDMNELHACKQFLPHVSTQFCKFHVMQAVMKELKKFPGSDTLKKFVQQCMYCKSEDAFKRSVTNLQKEAPTAFYVYFEKNWLSCAQHWASFQTDKFPNLGNTTNNRLESHNQKIKTVLDKNMSIADTVKNLLLLKQCKDIKTTHKQFEASLKVAYRINDKDGVETNIVNLLTPYYAAIIVLKELKCAYDLKQNNSAVTQDGLLAEDAVCSCSLRTTMALPCRHMLRSRLHNLQNMFSEEDAAPRWLQKNCQKTKGKKRKRSPSLPIAHSSSKSCLTSDKSSNWPPTFSSRCPMFFLTWVCQISFLKWNSYIMFLRYGRWAETPSSLILILTLISHYQTPVGTQDNRRISHRQMMRSVDIY